MHPLATLQEILETLGATLVERDLRPDLFGSGFAVYSKNGRSVRVVWDGKEGCGLLQAYSQSDLAWVDIYAPLSKGDLTERSKIDAQSSEVRRAAAAAFSARVA